MDNRNSSGIKSGASGVSRTWRQHGIDGIRPSTNKGGRKSKVTVALRKKLRRLFDRGLNAHEAYLELGDDPEVSYPVDCRVRRARADEHEHTKEEPADGGQLEFDGLGTDEEVIVDAVIVALGIGQRCVEGVRRLEASSGDVLLRTKRVPSESWARRVLKTYVEDIGGSYVHLAMTQNYLELAAARSKGATVFYVDNHLRPYTGKHTIRKGWRMQDKRVVAGITDYYVHDEDGRPVYRMSAPSNDTLTAWRTPVLQVLRSALGESQRMLVAFDRAGAFPEQLAELRDEGFEFVTYERRPYQRLAESAFTESLTVDGETYGVHESRLANLGKGRGRVRRIALLTPSGQQVNLLAVSAEKKERLIEVMLGRWVQENGFKHGNERWGINQLDRRKVVPYPPDAVIPNAARRRADNALPRQAGCGSMASRSRSSLNPSATATNRRPSRSCLKRSTAGS